MRDDASLYPQEGEDFYMWLVARFEDELGQPLPFLPPEVLLAAQPMIAAEFEKWAIKVRQTSGIGESERLILFFVSRRKADLRRAFESFVEATKEVLKREGPLSFARCLSAWARTSADSKVLEDAQRVTKAISSKAAEDFERTIEPDAREFARELDGFRTYAQKLQRRFLSQGPSKGPGGEGSFECLIRGLLSDTAFGLTDHEAAEITRRMSVLGDGPFASVLVQAKTDLQPMLELLDKVTAKTVTNLNTELPWLSLLTKHRRPQVGRRTRIANLHLAGIPNGTIAKFEGSSARVVENFLYQLRTEDPEKFPRATTKKEKGLLRALKSP